MTIKYNIRDNGRFGRPFCRSGIFAKRRYVKVCSNDNLRAAGTDQKTWRVITVYGKRTDEHE